MYRKAGMYPFWLLSSIAIWQYESIEVSLKKMCKKEKERIRAESCHHPWASHWGLVVLFLMFVGLSDGCRLIPSGGGGGGGGGNPKETTEKNPHSTPSIGFIFTQAQVGMPRYLPWGRDFKPDDLMLWIRGRCRSLCHLLRCYSCLLHQCSWVHYSPLWPIMAHQQKWEPSGHVWMSRGCGEELSQLSSLEWGQGDSTHPAGFASVLTLPAGLGSPPLHIGSLPRGPEPSAFQFLFQYRLWIHSSPQTRDD